MGHFAIAVVGNFVSTLVADLAVGLDWPTDLDLDIDTDIELTNAVGLVGS